MNQIKNMPNMTYDEIISLAMKKQPIENIGMIGHVSNGKSTLTECLTKTKTQKHTDELIRNITIKLGYANAKIFKCENGCAAPECYQSTDSSVMEHLCIICGNPTTLKMHTSHVDCPGHYSLMSVMLNGTTVMDHTILVESCANKIFPAPQTIEHYNITKEIGINPAFAVLNKSDLFSKHRMEVEKLVQNLRNFVGEDIKIVPISGTLGINIDVVCEYLANIKLKKKDLESDFKMLVIRSFNVNHPRTKINELKGGVFGGSLTRGIMKINDSCIVYPGFVSMKSNVDVNGQEIKWQYCPLRCNIISINSDKNSLDFAIPGGLIGVQLDIDPGMTCGDNLVGQVMFKESENMSHVKVYEIIQITYNKLANKTSTINTNDNISINVNSNKINCKVIKKKSKYLNLLLEKPICAEIGDKVTINIISNQTTDIDIYGYGEIIDGAESEQI